MTLSTAIIYCCNQQSLLSVMSDIYMLKPIAVLFVVSQSRTRMQKYCIQELDG